MGIHNYIMPMNTGDFTHTLHNMTFPECTKNTRSYIMTYTDHDRWLYIQYRSLPATLYTFYTIMYMSTEYTKNTRSCTMTQTGHDRWLYIQYRSLPATLYTFYTIMYSPRNTLKIHGRVLWPKPVTTDDFIINTGHCRRLYTRFTQLCVTPQNALKIHGRVLWHKPITTDDFIFVSHYYWGAGRPK